MNHTEVIERATIINRDTFRLDTDNPEIGDSGTRLANYAVHVLYDFDAGQRTA